MTSKAEWNENIRDADLDERGMTFTAIYTRPACMTLPLSGIIYKVAFLTPDQCGS